MIRSLALPTWGGLLLMVWYGRGTSFVTDHTHRHQNRHLSIPLTNPWNMMMMIRGGGGEGGPGGDGIEGVKTNDDENRDHNGNDDADSEKQRRSIMSEEDPPPIPHVIHPPDSSQADGRRRPRRRPIKQRRRAIILVDQFADYHGGYLSRVAREVWGVATVRVLSDYMVGYFRKLHPELVEPRLMRIPSIDDGGELQEWLEKLRSSSSPPVDRIEAIICESDSGLPASERFSMALGLDKCNGFNEARRDKHLMNDVVASKSHLPVVRQKLCSSVEEAVEFAKILSLANTADKADTAKYAHDFIPTGENRAAPLVGSSSSSSSAKPCEESDFSRLDDFAVLRTGVDATRNEDSQTQTLSSSSPRRTEACIVKPTRGVASESVFLCQNLDDVRMAFRAIVGTTVFGSPHETHERVLVQEYASGTEYALDTVSRNGEHKLAALWRYDKRSANDAPFVYFATELIDGDTGDLGSTLFDYASSALDALDIRWGLTHTEIILTTDGPRLVEVNCRQHNMDFLPIVMMCVGYNAFDMLLAAYLDGEDDDSGDIDVGDEQHDDDDDDDDDMRLDWQLLPRLPSIGAYGAMVHLVNYANGTLTAVNESALEEIRDMESVVNMEVYDSFLEPGGAISPTTDIRSDAGWVQLVNDDRTRFRKDYERIVELMPSLFDVR